MWFTEYVGGTIGRITPDGAITEYPLPDLRYGPEGIAAGPDGNMWFTESTREQDRADHPRRQHHRVSLAHRGGRPRTGSRPARTATCGSPSAAIRTQLDRQPDRADHPARHASPNTPCPRQGSSPSGIAAGPDGNLWFTEPAAQIGRITPAGAITEYPAAHSLQRPRGIAAGPDGNMWFTEPRECDRADHPDRHSHGR